MELRYFLIVLIWCANGVSVAQDVCLDISQEVLMTSTDGLLEKPWRSNKVRTIEQKEITEANCLLLDLQVKLSHMDRDEFQIYLENRGLDTNSIDHDFVNVELWKSHRQYVGSKSGRGDLLFVNGGCRFGKTTVHTEWIQVKDGGRCYWQALLNMTTREIIWVHVNGF